eukprot:TRINITY_DN9776_c0_g1_i1.p1 TRINITY_DN9776_c0_g1~~TRINITY_DN9776_c0_g1_i1.p1  ORF type:complete len:327 (+),score=31.34 TRINITY_DN9776_c0_g1_i1:85-1065(+)
MYPDDHTFGARPRVSSNSYASGANQNCGNVLSDTPTTRVAAPPGGRSSISLGWDTSSASERQPAASGGYRAAAGSPVKPQQQYYDEDATSSPYTAGFPSPQRGPAPVRDPPSEDVHGARPRVSSNQYACGSNQNQGNFLTDTPTTRVLRPPGGSSTAGMLSWDEDPRQARPQVGQRSTQQWDNGRQQARPQMGQRTGQQWDDDPRQAQPQAGQRAGQRWDDDPRQAQPQAGQRAGQRWDEDPHQARQPVGQRAGQRWDEDPHQGRQPVGQRAGPAAAGDMAFGQRTRVSSNSYANGADQNCGNVLSDTPTTRVLRPPGGHSTFTLG